MATKESLECMCIMCLLVVGWILAALTSNAASLKHFAECHPNQNIILVQAKTGKLHVTPYVKVLGMT